MRATTLFLVALGGFIFIASCQPGLNRRFDGEAYLVNNHRDKQPVEGVLFEMFYYQESVRDDEPFAVATTDDRGHFKIEGVSPGGGGFDIDGWNQAFAFADPSRTDTLGTLQFAYPGNDTYRYQTIRLDTFVMPHQVWVVPRVASLGTGSGNDLYLRMNQGGDFSPESNLERTYSGPFSLGQKLDAWPGQMSLGMQHWLSFGSREFGSATWAPTTEYSGNVKAPWRPRTIEGDTVYLDISFN